MIKGLHHTAIIVSSEVGVEFYKELGFIEASRIDRGYDQIVWLIGYGEKLELYIDGTHPSRLTKPEALGLRHLAFEVDDVELEWTKLSKYKPEHVRTREDGKKLFFVKDLARSIKGTTQVKSSSINAFRHFSKVA